VEKEGKKSGSKPAQVENKFQLLLTLITLLKSVRHKDKKTELEFLMVNQTFNLVPYKSCAYWEYKKNRVSIKNSSGLILVDNDGPYSQWLVRVIENFLKKQKEQESLENNDDQNSNKDLNSFSKLFTVLKDNCLENERDDWDKWVTKNAFILLIYNKDKKFIGGLWIDKKDEFSTLEKAILEDLGDGYAFALQNFSNKKRQEGILNYLSIFSLSGLKTKLFFLSLLLIMLLPVNMSATAPAEVVASKPDVISIPFDGVIEKVEISPGQRVKAGEVLLRMDDTLLKNKVIMTTGELNAAKVALLKTERESMKDRSKLAEIAILKAQLAQKNAEVDFAQQMLKLSEIVAERDGIAIFADINSLRGKPVQTGEQVMQLTSLEENELLIRMPVSSMIKINQDIPARFFLNVSPFDSQKISYKSIGYQSTMDTGGLMTYKIRGEFLEENDDVRIGWTGTGKVYGEKTILGISILRRPITTLRRKLGI